MARGGHETAEITVSEDHIAQGPSADYAVVGKGDGRDEHEEQVYQSVELHIALMPAQGNLRQEYRHADQQHAEYIYQYEGAASVFGYHIGEAPYIAQADCRAGEHEQCAESAGKLFLFHKRLKNWVRNTLRTPIGAMYLMSR